MTWLTFILLYLAAGLVVGCLSVYVYRFLYPKRMWSFEFFNDAGRTILMSLVLWWLLLIAHAVEVGCRWWTDIGRWWRNRRQPKT